LTALARTGQQGPFYIFAAFIFTYSTTVLHSTRNLLLAAVILFAIIPSFIPHDTTYGPQRR
jgi:hypothetical protein